MISVIVPVYKVEPYLQQCIDSILAQTYTDFELILVDDGSPDNCGAICDEYAKHDDRICVIHQENGGLSAARNTGIDAARGEYLTFIDSDDWITETYLKRLYILLDESHADISVCGMLSFMDGFEPESGLATVEGDLKIMTGRTACLSIYSMDGVVPIMAWGKLYRRQLFEDIRYPVGRIHEDDATTPKLLYRAKKVVLISDALYRYRRREESITSEAFSEKRFDVMYAVDSCISFFREAGDFELQHQAKQARRVMLAKLTVRAKYAQMADKLPKQYAMGEWKALRIIRSYATNDAYSWFLSMNHPRLVKPHAYIVKFKRLLGLKK